MQRLNAKIPMHAVWLAGLFEGFVHNRSNRRVSAQPRKHREAWKSVQIAGGDWKAAVLHMSFVRIGI